MKSPQLENGYTRIANELLEALIKFSIPQEVSKIIWAVIRKTYGYGKKEDWIALSQFCYLTGLRKPNVIRAIHKAKTMKLIISTDNGRVKKYHINKDFSTWKSLSVQITVIPTDNDVIPTDNKSLSLRRPTKDTIQKKTIQKKEGRFAPPSLEEVSNYCKELKNGIDASQWIDFYTSKGWFIGKNKMKDWKAAVRTWENRTKGEDSPVITIGKKSG